MLYNIRAMASAPDLPAQLRTVFRNGAWLFGVYGLLRLYLTTTPAGANLLVVDGLAALALAAVSGLLAGLMRRRSRWALALTLVVTLGFMAYSVALGRGFNYIAAALGAILTYVFWRMIQSGELV
jgi:hypothetical protein